MYGDKYGCDITPDGPFPVTPDFRVDAISSTVARSLTGDDINDAGRSGSPAGAPGIRCGTLQYRFSPTAFLAGNRWLRLSIDSAKGASCDVGTAHPYGC